MATTQLRLSQVTGSLDDTKLASANISESSIQGVLDHVAASIKRIHGGSVFQNQTAGHFGHSLHISASLIDFSGANAEIRATDNSSPLKLTSNGGTNGFVFSDSGNANSSLSLKFDGPTNAAILRSTFNSGDIVFGTSASGNLSEIARIDGSASSLLMNGSKKIEFGDTGTYIYQSNDGQLDVDADIELEITSPIVDIDASTAVRISNDLELDSDEAVLKFGADKEVTLTHVADTGLLLNAAMQLRFRDSAIHISSDDDGYMNVQADTGVNININGNDELAITASTATFGTNIVVPNGATIGSVSDQDAIAIAASGDVTLSQDLSVAGDLTVTGNLNVNGVVTTIDTANLQVEDSIILLGSGSGGESSAGDRGIIMAVDADTNPVMFWDNSANQFAFARTSNDATGTEITVATYEQLKVGSLVSEASITTAIINTHVVYSNAGVLSGSDSFTFDGSDLKLADSVGLVLSTDEAEKIESDGTDLTVSSGGNIKLASAGSKVDFVLDSASLAGQVIHDSATLILSSSANKWLALDSNGGRIMLAKDLAAEDADRGAFVMGNNTLILTSSLSNELYLGSNTGRVSFTGIAGWNAGGIYSSEAVGFGLLAMQGNDIVLSTPEDLIAHSGNGTMILKSGSVGSEVEIGRIITSNGSGLVLSSSAGKHLALDSNSGTIKLAKGNSVVGQLVADPESTMGLVSLDGADIAFSSATDKLKLYTAGTVNLAGEIITDYSGDGLVLSSSAGKNLVLDANSSKLKFAKAGVEHGSIVSDLGLVLSSSAGKDLFLESNSNVVKIKGNSPSINPFFIDMSDSGTGVQMGINNMGQNITRLTLSPGGSHVLSGSLSVKDTGSTNGKIKLFNSAGTFYSSLSAPVGLSTDVTFTLPSTNGTAGYVLQTNGSGVTSWAIAGSQASAGKSVNTITTALSAGAESGFSVNTSAISSLYERNSIDVFVNGMLMMSSSTVYGSFIASSDGDYSMSGIGNSSKFKFSFGLEPDDVVTVITRA